MRAKHSGGKRGTGVNWTGSPAQRVSPMAKSPGLTKPDHVAGVRLLDRLPVLTEEAVRAGEADRPPQARVEDLHVLLEAPGADPQERHPVAVSRVHVRLDFEDEAGEIGIVRRHEAPIAGTRTGRRQQLGQGIEEGADAEVRQRAAEQDRRLIAGQEAIEVEGATDLRHQRHLLAQPAPGRLPEQGDHIGSSSAPVTTGARRWPRSVRSKRCRLRWRRS